MKFRIFLNPMEYINISVFRGSWSHQFWAAISSKIPSVGCGTNVSFQSLCNAIWIFPIGVPPSGQSATWVKFYPKSVFKGFEMLIRITFLHMHSWQVSPGVCTQLHGFLSQTLFIFSLALSNLLRIFFSLLQQDTVYFYNYACLWTNIGRSD